jgi:hypothetical protein
LAPGTLRCFYRIGSLVAVSEELSKYSFFLVGMQKVRWEGDVTEPAVEQTFFYGKKIDNYDLGSRIVEHNRIIS